MKLVKAARVSKEGGRALGSLILSVWRYSVSEMVCGRTCARKYIEWWEKLVRPWSKTGSEHLMATGVRIETSCCLFEITNVNMEGTSHIKALLCD